jgi:hypothetical protein
MRTPIIEIHDIPRYRRLDEKIKELKGEPLEHWTFHDVRRTAGTGLEKLHFPLPVTEAVLNHISGSKGGIVELSAFTKGMSTRTKSARPWINGPDTLKNLSTLM